jgi:hypothetical protein
MNVKGGAEVCRVIPNLAVYRPKLLRPQFSSGELDPAMAVS